MISLADLAAAKCAEGVLKRGGDLADYRRTLVFGERNDMNLIDVLEEAVIKGCRDPDILRRVVASKVGTFRPDITDTAVESVVQRGWGAMLSELSDAWFENNVQKVVLTNYIFKGVQGLTIDGVPYGEQAGEYESATPTNLSLFPSDVARHLVRTCKCASDLPDWAKHLSAGREVSTAECTYYLGGYITLHVERERHYTPFKLPDYADAKAASGLTDEQFRTMWDVFCHYEDFQGEYADDFHFFEDDNMFYYIEWHRDQLPGLNIDEEVVDAWTRKVRPMCTALPGVAPRRPLPAWMNRG